VRPWIEYLVSTLDGAYADFEARVAARRNLGALSKQGRVREYVLHHAAEVFRLRDVRVALPGVRDPTIRLVLSELRPEGLIQIDETTGGHRPRAPGGASPEVGPESGRVPCRPGSLAAC